MSHNQPLRLDRIFQRYDPPLFFVTLCAARRRKVLASGRAHAAFANYAEKGRDHNVAVGRYVLMPDHIHFFVAGDHKYVRENPVCAGLVRTTEDWPFQGEIVEIDHA